MRPFEPFEEKLGPNVLKTGFKWPSTQRLTFEVSY